MKLQSAEGINFDDSVAPLLGLPVSYLWRGYGSAIFLEFGPLSEGRRRRDGSAGNPVGEWTLMVEWSWRIEGKRRIWCGSWSDQKRWSRAFEYLNGATVVSTHLFASWRIVLALIALLPLPLVGRAQALSNLAQQGWYADPEIHLFQGQYWIYPTYSGETPPSSMTLTSAQQARRASPVVFPQFPQQTFLDAFSSTDLVHWVKHEHVLDVTSVAWAAYAVWADGVASRDSPR